MATILKTVGAGGEELWPDPELPGNPRTRPQTQPQCECNPPKDPKPEQPSQVTPHLDPQKL